MAYNDVEVYRVVNCFGDVCFKFVCNGQMSVGYWMTEREAMKAGESNE